MARRINVIRAFLMGMWEFHSSITTRYEDDRAYDAYDYGRELAHRLTRRRWDHNY